MERRRDYGEKHEWRNRPKLSEKKRRQEKAEQGSERNDRHIGVSADCAVHGAFCGSLCGAKNRGVGGIHGVNLKRRG